MRMGTVPPLYGENEFFLIPPQTKERPVKLSVLIQKLERQTGPVPIHQKPTKLIDLTVLLPSTPALDDSHVYSVWGHATELMVTAHNHSGDLIWEKDLGGVNGGHGFAVSPIVFEDLLIVPNDQEKGGGAHYALDCKTGKIKWKVPRESKRLTYSTPCIFTPPNGRHELIFTNWWLGFTSMEPRTGKKLWELSVFGRPHSERAISSPIVAGDLVLGVCGFTTLDKHLVAIRPASVSKNGKAEEVWRLEDTMPHIPSPLVSGNRLYLWADNGVITCVRPHNGKLVWKARVEGVRDTFLDLLYGLEIKSFAYQHTGKWW